MEEVQIQGCEHVLPDGRVYVVQRARSGLWRLYFLETAEASPWLPTHQAALEWLHGNEKKK